MINTVEIIKYLSRNQIGRLVEVQRSPDGKQNWILNALRSFDQVSIRR